MPGVTAPTACVQTDGHQVGRYALRSWLRASGQRALSTRTQCPRTTQPNPAAVVAKSRLLGQPAPALPNQVWVSDITYLPLLGGRWCYLATWRDASQMLEAHFRGAWWAGTSTSRCL